MTTSSPWPHRVDEVLDVEQSGRDKKGLPPSHMVLDDIEATADAAVEKIGADLAAFWTRPPADPVRRPDSACFRIFLRSYSPKWVQYAIYLLMEALPGLGWPHADQASAGDKPVICGA